MKKFLATIIIAILASVSCLTAGNTFARAEEQNAPTERVQRFPLYYMDIVLDDDMVVITSTTSEKSENWETLGILNIENAKSEFKDRSVAAVIGNKDTKKLVYFISKRTDYTFEKFDTRNLTDDDVKEYAESLVDYLDMDKEITVYHHPQGSFFKLCLGDEENGEVIIGTIFNGMLVQFSSEYEVGGTGVDEEFLERVVSNVRLTNPMTREEYEAEQSRQLRKLFIIIAVIILVFIGLIFIGLWRKKRAKKKSDEIAAKMANYRDRKKAGEITQGEPLFTVDTVYDSKLIDAFIKYDTWFKNMRSLILGVLVYAFIIWYCSSHGGTVLMIFTIAVGIVVLYMNFSGGEKKKDALYRSFVVKEKKTATFRFYEESFTMSGLSSMTEFIYQQVTAVKVNNGFIFLYMSDDYAVFIDMEGMELEKAGSLIHMLKEKTK